MKVLTLDCETSPMVCYSWGLKNQFISIGQIIEPTRLLCFGAKWLHEKRVQHYSEWVDGKQGMLDAAHRLISEADVIVGFNHRSFDMKHFTREFMEAGMTPPSPVQLVDLYLESRQAFFPSHKLQWVSTRLGLEGKLSHTGFKLWADVLAGDPKAQRLMERYCKQDVSVTEELYREMLPWLKSQPTASLYADDESDELKCPKCDSPSITRQGFKYTKVGKYQAYRCSGCGGWSQGRKNFATTDLRSVS